MVMSLPNYEAELIVLNDTTMIPSEPIL